MRPVLPARSPTVVLICPRAIRMNSYCTERGRPAPAGAVGNGGRDWVRLIGSAESNLLKERRLRAGLALFGNLCPRGTPPGRNARIFAGWSVARAGAVDGGREPIRAWGRFEKSGAGV
jgi:hypothetical protein